MKPEAERLVGAREVWGLPRLLRRGLIEAGVDDEYRIAPAGGLPRLLRRGLIEAKATSRPARSLMRDFPGYFAGASLKLGISSCCS